MNVPLPGSRVAPARRSLVGHTGSVPPLQSLSTASPQNSRPGVPAVALHWMPVPAALHTHVPVAAHAPTPTEHAVPLSGHGSSMPLAQSSSTPLQVSVVEPVVSVHTVPVPAA